MTTILRSTRHTNRGGEYLGFQLIVDSVMKSMVSFSIIFILPVFLLCAVGPAQGASPGLQIELDTIRSDGIAVHFDKPLLEAARQIIRLFPAVKDELTKQFQWEVRFQPKVILIRDHKAFTLLAGNDMVVAFADSERQVIVIDYSRVAVNPIDLEVTFKHELCHLLLHAYIPDNLPRWFNEGVCQWATGGLAEIFLDHKRPVLSDVALAGKLLRFYNLSAHFPEDRHDLILAYEQSRSLIEYITATYGTPKLLQLLNVLKDGKSIDDAVQETLNVTIAELEQRWVSHLNEKITWLIYISDNLYEILFFFASLMTVIAAVKIIVRKLKGRRMSQEDEDEE